MRYLDYKLTEHIDGSTQLITESVFSRDKKESLRSYPNASFKKDAETWMKENIRIIKTHDSNFKSIYNKHVTGEISPYLPDDLSDMNFESQGKPVKRDYKEYWKDTRFLKYEPDYKIGGRLGPMTHVELTKVTSKKSTYYIIEQDIPLVKLDSHELRFLDDDGNTDVWIGDKIDNICSDIKDYVNKNISIENTTIRVDFVGDNDSGPICIMLKKTIHDDITTTEESVFEEKSNEDKKSELDNIHTAEDLYNWMHKNIKYHHSEKLRSPEEVLRELKGDCHDQALFEHEYLKSQYNLGRIFMIEYYSLNQPGGSTHTLLWYSDPKDGKFYWFENAWGDQSGIHGPYESIQKLKDDVASKWKYSGKNDKLFMKALSTVKPGMTLGEYVNANIPDGILKATYTKESVFEETTSERAIKLPSGDKMIDLRVFHETPYGEMELLKALNNNPWFGADYHMMENEVDKYAEIINAYVKPNDDFIILGDLDPKHEEPDIDNTITFLKRLNCKKVHLILGNNDCFKIRDYVLAGFKSVTNKIQWNNLVFTHFPRYVGKDEVNIHGHMHGAGFPENKGKSAYWYADPNKCIDVWRDDFKPQRLNDLLKKYHKKICDTNITYSKSSIDAQKVSDEINADKSIIYREVLCVNNIPVSCIAVTKTSNVIIKTKSDYSKKVYEEKLLSRFLAYNKNYSLVEKFNYVKESDNMDGDIDIVTEEANYNKRNKYPVFLILTDSNSFMAKGIKLYTGQPWAHALISFNTDLDPSFSFGATSLKPPKFGFITKNEEDPFREIEAAKYVVYVMYVNKTQYIKMRKKLEFFEANKSRMGYSWLGLVTLMMKVPKQFRNRYFCSQFVMDLIGETSDIPKDPSLWTPGDIAELKNITLVDAGLDLRNYDKRKLERNLKKVQAHDFSRIKVGFESSDDIVDDLYEESTIYAPVTIDTKTIKATQICEKAVKSYEKNTKDLVLFKSLKRKVYTRDHYKKEKKRELKVLKGAYSYLIDEYSYNNKPVLQCILEYTPQQCWVCTDFKILDPSFKSHSKYYEVCAYIKRKCVNVQSCLDWATKVYKQNQSSKEVKESFDDIINSALDELFTETTVDSKKVYFKEHIAPRVDATLNKPENVRKFNQFVNSFINRNIMKLTKSGPCDMIAFTDTDHKALFDLFGFEYTIDKRPKVTSPNEITDMVNTFSKEEKVSLKFFASNPSQVLLYYVIRYFTMHNDSKSLNSALSIYALCVYPLMFAKYFPYGVMEPIMQYTIDNLTDKFIIKKSKHLFAALLYSIQNSYNFHKSKFSTGNDAHMIAWVERIRNDQNSLFKKIANEYMKNWKAGNAAKQTNEQFDNDTPIIDELENATTSVQNIVQKVTLPIIENGVDLIRAEAAAKMGGVSVSDCRFFLTLIISDKNVDTMQSFIESILFLYLYEEKRTERDIRSQYFLAWAASLFKKTNSKNKNINNINEILNRWAEETGIHKKFAREASRINYKKAIFFYVVLCIQKAI